MRKLEEKYKTAAVIFLIAAVIIFFYSRVALADSNSPGVLGTAVDYWIGQGSSACISNPAACSLYLVVFFITRILALLVQLGAFLVNVALKFNDGLAGAPAVTSGFSVALSVANLGFVLGVIIIALATILRRETYGIKSLLGKLIFMAILVNFSLVISGIVINFSDSFTHYFIKAATADGDYNTFAARIVSALGPQSFDIRPDTSTSFGVALQGFSGLISTVLNMVFSAVMVLLIAFTFVAMAVLLLIRYVYLSILLIIAPVAWLTYVFPKFSQHFTSWWNSFLRWSFFPAIMTFFIYLAVMTTSGTGQSFYTNKYQDSVSGTGGVTALASATGQSSGFFANAAKAVTLLGLVLGGLFAANKMSIAGASTALGMAKSAGGAVGGYLGRRGRQAATAPLRTQWMREKASSLQQPGRGFFTRWTGRILQAGAVAGGEGAVESAQKRLGGLKGQQRADRLSTVPAPDRMFLLESMAKDKELGLLSLGAQEQFFGKSKENEFGGYGDRGQKLLKEMRENSDLGFIYETDELERLRSAGAPAADIETQKRRVLSLAVKKDPDSVAKTISQSDAELRDAQDKAKKTTGKVPASLDDRSVKATKEAVMEGITEGFSNSVVSDLLHSLAKQNNIDKFVDRIREIETGDPAKFANLQSKLRGNTARIEWNNRSILRGVLDLDLKTPFHI